MVCSAVTLFATLFATLALPARLPASSEDQNPKPETAGRYLILDEVSVKTMQRKLDDAATAGFRVVSGVASKGFSYNILVLEKDPAGKKREYLFTDAFYHTVKEGEVKGYRVLPFTFAAGKESLCAVFEKLSEGEAQPEYRVVSTMRPPTSIRT
jgi:hypothetical protein